MWAGLFLGLVLGAPSGVEAAPNTESTHFSSGSLEFYADAAAYLSREDHPVARFYVEIPYRSLHFTRQGPAWVARVDVTILVYDRSGNQVAGDLWPFSIKTSDLEQAQKSETIFRRRFDLEVTAGRLRCETRVEQPGSGRDGKWVVSLDVPRYDSKPLALADILFGRCDTDSATPIAGWSIGKFNPSPRRRYGDSQPLMCVYGEIYDRSLLPDSAYAVACEIRNTAGKVLTAWADQIRRRGNRGAFYLHPAIADLAFGSYTLRVDVSLGTEKARQERSFEMDETRMNVVENPDMIRGVLGYVAGNDELIRLEKLPSDSLKSFWEEFWARRDPTPGTPRNENLSEFLRRLEYAAAHFSVLEPGWKSDMGRVYIRFGPPDEMEKVPFGSSGPPQEVWYYHSRGQRFVFIDYDGFGRYRLAGTQRP